jgi:transposase
VAGVGNAFGARQPLTQQSLAEEKFHWPDANTQLITITGEQLNWLLDGYDIARMKPHKVLRYESVC